MASKDNYIKKFEGWSGEAKVVFKDKDKLKDYYDTVLTHKDKGVSKRDQKNITLNWMSLDGDIENHFKSKAEDDNADYLASSNKAFKSDSLSKLSNFKVDKEYQSDTVDAVIKGLKEELSVKLDSLSIGDLRSNGRLQFEEGEVQDLFDNRVFNKISEFRRDYRDAKDVQGLERLRSEASNTKYSDEAIRDIDRDIERIRGV